MMSMMYRGSFLETLKLKHVNDDLKFGKPISYKGTCSCTTILRPQSMIIGPCLIDRELIMRPLLTTDQTNHIYIHHVHVPVTVKSILKECLSCHKIYSLSR